MSIRLVLGGARSGKSSFAESLVMKSATQNSKARHYVATAQPMDDEMRRRIAHHQFSRDDQWQEHECPLALPPLLTQFTEHDLVLVDCLTLWLNNVIYHRQDEQDIEQAVKALTNALNACHADVVLVSNEVGLGVIPMGEETRLFVDNAGWMNQAIAKIADDVTFVAAGLPLALKGSL
ncbi:bifunctional adenosylcobinamide kinase/adenosylcobinamide-phosphate guanylyltransferase [Vibrio sp. TRT 17S01]|uniref:bifunctional adenosylcobinamide kinase/adenosylcobinamide-phosphate guanylyltransferase n=1 Tax=Vibrio sp. TRT 17S01 TaxID=3418505 RepID=UPI003CF0E823